MFCTACGLKVEGSFRFCPGCGAAVVGTNPGSATDTGAAPVSRTATHVEPAKVPPVSASATRNSRGPTASGAQDDLDDLSQTLESAVPARDELLCGRYRLLSRIGVGGMGEVWRARDERLELDVAVKVLPALLARSRRSLESLKREAQLSIRLTHPGIARTYTFDLDEGRPVLVMELVEGGTLEHEIDEAGGLGLAVERVLDLGEQLAAALDHAHGQEPPVLHRDVKPANVLLAGGRRAKLTDFGIAAEAQTQTTVVTQGRGLGSAGPASGTLCYMPPEQLLGRRCGPASDVYALAATLWECLCGRPPFSSGDVGYQVLHAIPELPEDAEEATRPLLEVLLRGLLKEPGKRPGSAGELVTFLRKAAEGGGQAAADAAIAEEDDRRVTSARDEERQKVLELLAKDHHPAWRRAAEAGVAAAQGLLGRCFRDGISEEQDDAQAVSWYRKAAEQGNAAAQFNLGVMYAQGRGVAEDYAEAVLWLRKAAEQGNATAQCGLGETYASGFGVAEDYAQAVSWFRKAAEQGDVEAQCNLGVMYADGRGVAKDDAQAVSWYRKAAEQGHTEAQCRLGSMYENGRGMAKDDTQAVSWYRLAAEQGHTEAQYNLGVMYAKGFGVVQDSAEAAAWYRKAAEEGNAAAQNNLGWMYENGLGVAKDDAQAVSWYHKAAEQGHATAQSNLGVMYAQGRGVAKDDAQAVSWYRKAAEQGHAEATEALEAMTRDVELVVEVRVPNLGKSIAEAKLVKWHKASGQTVRKDEPLCEVETDRVHVDISSPAAGILCIIARGGSGVRVGDHVGLIYSPSLIPIEMPQLSDSMTHGTVMSWLIKEGDYLRAGQIVAEVETDKATMEMESFDKGFLAKIIAGAGAVVPVGEPIALLSTKRPIDTGKPRSVEATEAKFGLREAGTRNSNLDTKGGVPTARPAGSIGSVGVELTRAGIFTNVSITLNNLKGTECLLVAQFEDSNGQKLMDRNDQFRLPDGQVAVIQALVPENESSRWEKLSLFMPYEELHLSRWRKHQCRLCVRVYTPDGKGGWQRLLKSDYYPFTYP